MDFATASRWCFKSSLPRRWTRCRLTGAIWRRLNERCQDCSPLPSDLQAAYRRGVLLLKEAMRFPPSFLDDIRGRVSISSVVGRKVAWDRRKTNAGKGDFWACCPFHGE